MYCLQVPTPEFEGQTKAKLGNPEVRRIVEGVINSVSPHLQVRRIRIVHLVCEDLLCIQVKEFLLIQQFFYTHAGGMEDDRIRGGLGPLFRFNKRKVDKPF